VTYGCVLTFQMRPHTEGTARSGVGEEPRDGVRLIEVDQTQPRRHAGGVVRQAVEDTLDDLLDPEADALFFP
jgi:hypothetical protein